jgi:toxin YoeB
MDEYVEWQTEDRKILKRINVLLKDVDRHPFTGIGKPEPLKGGKQGYWSRRIDEVNRIVYKVERDQLIIVQCGRHYND